MATTVYLKQQLNSNTGLSQLYNYANPTRSVLAAQTAITATVASGTKIQVTQTSGGVALKWISPPLAQAVTIAGTVTFNLWGLESSASANCTFAMSVIKFTGGAEGATVVNTASFVTELTTSNAVKNWTASPASTAFAIGDRIVLEVFIVNVGTMGGPFTATLNYAGKTAAASGDAFVTFTETIAFQPEAECVQMVQAIIASGTTTLTATFTGLVAKGNTLLVFVTWISASTPTLTLSDNQTGGSNSYTTLQSFPNWAAALGNINDKYFYFPNCAGGVALAIKVTSTVAASAANDAVIVIQEWAGLTAAPLDQHSSATGSSTAPNSGNITPTFPRSLIWGGPDSQNVPSAVPPQQYNRSNDAILYDFVIDAVTTEAISSTQTTGSWAAYVASFQVGVFMDEDLDAALWMPAQPLIDPDVMVW